jgi:hypothetical protein
MQTLYIQEILTVLCLIISGYRYKSKSPDSYQMLVRAFWYIFNNISPDFPYIFGNLLVKK